MIFTAQHLRTVDGDTAILLVNLDLRHLGIDQYSNLSVRLLHINAPELTSPFPDVRAEAQAAKAFLDGLIHGKQVTIDAKGCDKYKRPLVDIWVGTDTTQKTVNQQMLDSGNAVPMDMAKTISLLVDPDDAFTKMSLTQTKK